MVNVYIDKSENHSNSPINKYNKNIKLIKKKKIIDEYKSINQYI